MSDPVWFVVQRTPVGLQPAIVHDPKGGHPRDAHYAVRLDTLPPGWLGMSLSELMAVYSARKKIADSPAAWAEALDIIGSLAAPVDPPQQWVGFDDVTDERGRYVRLGPAQ